MADNDEKRGRDPRVLLAKMIMDKTWDWDEVQAVYIPKKLHRELTRMTERIAKEMPDVKNGPADVANLQHFVAMAVAYQMAMAAMHLLERNPLVRLVFAFGEVIKDILGDLVDCDSCERREECADGCSEKKDGEEAFTESSPLN